MRTHSSRPSHPSRPSRASRPVAPVGGRHELGQNFLVHQATIDRVVALTRATRGPILEIGAGDGAITRHLARLGRDLLAIDLDGASVRRLAERLPSADIRQADALRFPLDRPVVVGNLPFHLTTPILRRLLGSGRWRSAIVITQWEVARKRAGVGGRTMMTAQAAPWFDFALHARVPSDGFRPRPSVDGGLLTVERRRDPLIRSTERRAYERFVAAVFTGHGRGMDAILANAVGVPTAARRSALAAAEVAPSALPRDLTAEAWVQVWAHCATFAGGARGRR
ncbi:mycinamicin-resistance protein MyrB [Leifsonia sp. Root227]|uniref:23S ribosomal RNA methyltransferase Erm n=1 Tax=unclassified Leifsonia TaxID=2663824 RepID=UPI0006F1CA6D|nr:23S ribosomal RNA methyltransferase Erm [Leifsonia sp. Root227]KRC47156.1 mycinamicin-resistance protein MyrB [Leifsonia sp. Root227]